MILCWVHCGASPSVNESPEAHFTNNFPSKSIQRKIIFAINPLLTIQSQQICSDTKIFVVMTLLEFG